MLFLVFRVIWVWVWMVVMGVCSLCVVLVVSLCLFFSSVWMCRNSLFSVVRIGVNLVGVVGSLIGVSWLDWCLVSWWFSVCNGVSF